jgi:hypothetical protein
MRELGPIILVEDPFIRSYLRFVLMRHGYSVLESDPGRACELLTSDGGILVTNTPEPFLPCAHKLALVYLAASPDIELASHFPACRVLRKPFQPDELVKAVEGLVPPE